MNTLISEILNGGISNEKMNTIMTSDTPSKISSQKKMSDYHWLELLKEMVFNLAKGSKFNMDFLGEKMNLSRRQLQRKVKKITGLPPKIYIKELRLKESLRLLEEGEVNSVKELASRMGFMSPEYFSSQFKKRFKRVPSSFLKI